MSKYQPREALPLLSSEEEEVWRALKALPKEYTLDWGKRFLLYDSGDEFPSVYRPDFEIGGPGGHRLVIEALSNSSLTMFNLARLLRANEQIQASGKSFLILVWGTGQLTPKATAIPEFQTLPLRTAATDADVVRIVMDEFAGMACNAA